MLKHLKQAFLMSALMLLVCGYAYPYLMSGLSAVFFPEQAVGSLIKINGKPVGSAWVGQTFTDMRFMRCRPSGVNYNVYAVGEDGTKRFVADNEEFSGVASGSDNYAPSNPALHERVKNDLAAFLAANPEVRTQDIPTDLLTASGSGLDPHISPASAAVQLPALVKNTGLSKETLERIVSNNTEGKVFGVLGENRVNVLKVNIDIARELGLL